MSAAESRSAPAAMFSARWSGFPVPGMAGTCGPCPARRRPAELPLGGRRPGAEGVLHADHRRLGELRGSDVGQAEVADETGVAQGGQGGEVPGDRAGPVAGRDAEVDHVQVVAAQPAQVLLDLAAELPGGGPGPLAGRGAARPDLGGDDQIVRVGGERPADQLVGGGVPREAEGGGADVIHAELDRAAQHGDRAAAVARRSQVEGGAAGQAHRAEADPAHGQVAVGAWSWAPHVLMGSGHEKGLPGGRASAPERLRRSPAFSRGPVKSL